MLRSIVRECKRIDMRMFSLIVFLVFTGATGLARPIEIEVGRGPQHERG
jgi:hypothetical protein